MDNFKPGDKVIKKTETDSRNFGQVMDIQRTYKRREYVPVYFERHVWIKPENLMHFEEWQAKRTRRQRIPENLSKYWSGGY